MEQKRIIQGTQAALGIGGIANGLTSLFGNGPALNSSVGAVLQNFGLSEGGSNIFVGIWDILSGILLNLPQTGIVGAFMGAFSNGFGTFSSDLANNGLTGASLVMLLGNLGILAQKMGWIEKFTKKS